MRYTPPTYSGRHVPYITLIIPNNAPEMNPPHGIRPLCKKNCAFRVASSYAWKGGGEGRAWWEGDGGGEREWVREGKEIE